MNFSFQKMYRTSNKTCIRKLIYVNTVQLEDGIGKSLHTDGLFEIEFDVNNIFHDKLRFSIDDILIVQK